MNIRRRTGISGPGCVAGSRVKGNVIPNIGVHATPNMPAHINNAVGMRPQGGKSQFKKIRNTVNP